MKCTTLTIIKFYIISTLKSNIFLGIELILKDISSKYHYGINFNDLPFGKYLLTMAFILSFVPLWNEQYGSHLYSFTPNFLAVIPNALNSIPLSVVMDFTSISFLIIYSYINLFM